MTDMDVMARAERILVVEDDQFSQQLIGLYLGKAGFSQVTAAADGRDALDIAKRQRFDLVLLDLNLPRMNGAEVLRRLKKEGMLTDIPVIITSSMGNMDDIVHCMDLGAEDFLLKPFNVRLLENRVSAILEKKRLRDQGQAAHARHARDVRGARALQAALSGITLPSTVTEPGQATAAAMVLPAQDPGGDFHDVFPLPGSAVFFLLGSVAGSGTDAALAMGRTHALIRRAVDRIVAEGGHVEPHAVLAWANRELCQEDGAAVSVLAGVYSPGGNVWDMASAGHPNPLFLDPRRGVETAECDRGRPLGLHPDATYSRRQWTGSGDETLVAFSQGAMDAADLSGVVFGESRIRAVLNGCAVPDPAKVVMALEADIRRFVGRQPLAADATILAIRHGG